ncbi:response regulator [Polyangium jinanense]|uniref:Response regulator n=1 Tax=Polyangium jinanense TaxID=2829994 RepID=A0A9X3WZT4_9BACT|nr:response regulator [Polyangium jinanense]MDC3954830.1 response regulator [Polyangium jinanense]MDC3981399.1 response regulator [Polyangium jinanense]
MSTSNVLVVDDDPDILETTRFVLESAGYQVSTAANGNEALSRLHCEAAPCVILLDLMMPVMDGWAFRAEQVRDPGLAGIPVIIVTGAGRGARSAESLGAACLLEKPVDLSTLLSKVGCYCKTGADEPCASPGNLCASQASTSSGWNPNGPMPPL